MLRITVHLICINYLNKLPQIHYVDHICNMTDNCQIMSYKKVR